MPFPQPWALAKHSSHEGFCAFNLRIWLSVSSLLCCNLWKLMEAGTEAEGHGGVLPTGLLPRACSAHFLIAPMTTSPRVASTAHKELYLPTSIINQENV